TGTRIELVGMFELSDATNAFHEIISVPFTGVPSARNSWSWIVVSGGAASAVPAAAHISAVKTTAARPALAPVSCIALLPSSPRFACRGLRASVAPGPLSKATTGRQADFAPARPPGERERLIFNNLR